MHVINAAIKLTGFGFRVIPLHGVNSDGVCTCFKGPDCKDAGKHPIEKGWREKSSTDPEVVKAKFTKYPFANVGIETGKKSGITVLDVDGEDGFESVEKLNLPTTPVVLTGSGNAHYYFKYVNVKNKVKFAPGLDLRSDDGLIVAPPSLHACGKPYAWSVDDHIDDVELAEFPKEILKTIKTAEKQKKMESISQGIPSGKRNEVMYSVGGSIRNRGADEGVLYAALSSINQTECSPPLEDSEIKTIVKKLMAYEPKNEDGKSEDFHPVHIAEFFLKQNNLTLKKWRKDFYLFKEDHYEKIGDDYFESILQTWLKKDVRFIKYIGKNKVQQVIKCFNQLEHIVSDEFEMNIRPGLIPLKNGVFSVDKFLAGKNPMVEHSPDFLCTYCLPFEYDPKAKCKTFDKIRIDILGNKKNAAVWDEVLGYHLYQINKLENFFMLYGDGGNGKTVLLTILSALLGEKNVSSVSLENLTSQSFALSETLGKLANIIPELPHIDRANEAIIKAFVSREIMTFDRKWKPAINTRPTAVLTMATNLLPQFQDKSDGLWRRMILFEISHKIDEKKKDRRLIDPGFWHSSGELPGIFNRALDGLRRIHVRGKIDETSAMKENKREYREELNSVLRFLKENCTYEEGTYAPTTWVYACYCAFAKAEGHRYMPAQSTFIRQIKAEIEREGLRFSMPSHNVRLEEYSGRVFENMRINEFLLRRAKVI